MNDVRNEYFGEASGSKCVERQPTLPRSLISEQGLLSCLVQSPAECMPLVLEQFAGEQAIYDERHQAVFRALVKLWNNDRAIDLITLQQELIDAREFDGVGGYAYLSEIIDKAPSAANLPFYLEGVWEKYLARKLLENSQRVAGSIYATNGINETLLGQLATLHEDFMRKSQRGAVTPQHLKPVSEFAEDAAERFYGMAKEGAPGLDLPFPFPLRFRPAETTLLFGDDGSGKSTVLSYVLLHLLRNEGQKLAMASFEVPPDVTLWMMAAQLLGRASFHKGSETMKTISAAMAWLNTRVVFYDFQGIADWREVRDTFRYAAEKQKATLFSIDNAMRMGIADDDYAQQALAAATLHTFAEDHEGHVFIVLHENKGEGKGKAKIRGSKLWSANMNNVLSVRRNMDKQALIDKEQFMIDVERAQKEPDEAEIRGMEAKIGKLSADWDSEFLLHKQRYPGTRQNGSKKLWFDPKSFQFRHVYPEGAVDWLGRWRTG